MNAPELLGAFVQNGENDTFASANPFAVEHRKSNVRPNQFVPDTRLVVMPALRTTGFLATIGDRDMRALLAVLTFLTADGRIQATVQQVAQALGVSEKDARERLLSLSRMMWQGIPILVEVGGTQAASYYSPGHQIVRHTHEEPVTVGVEIALASRSDLIERNREKYTKPREEVERIVAGQLGHVELEPADNSPESEARCALVAFGVARNEAELLVRDYPLESIQHQIDWLPKRHARNPARFLVAAIRGDYAPPPEQDSSSVAPTSVP